MVSILINIIERDNNYNNEVIGLDTKRTLIIHKHIKKIKHKICIIKTHHSGYRSLAAKLDQPTSM